MASTIEIPPSSLLIDPENPRLPQPNIGQRDAMRALAQAQGRKLLTLAKDIVKNRLSPAELPVVMKMPDDRYIVLEGNRRLVALKALENPDSFVGALVPSILGELHAVAKQYQEDPIDSVSCCLVKDRAEADHWIHLKHTGECEGAGVVRWGSDEASRFKARGGKADLTSQVLDFLENGGYITPKDRTETPRTNLRRLLGTPEVRTKVGVGWEDGKITLLADEKKVAKALLHVIKDLRSGTKVEAIYNKKQRIEYADAIPPSIAIKAVSGNGAPVSSSTGKASVRTSHAARAKAAKPRDRLIPSSCVLKVKDTRLRDIVDELRKLSLDAHTNAVSVLLRVFLELSIDAYISANGIPKSKDPSLRNKMTSVINDLLARKKLTPDQAKPARRACQKDSFLAPSITLLHSYIHSPSVFPTPTDLRANWNNLQPFVTAIWSP